MSNRHRAARPSDRCGSGARFLLAGLIATGLALSAAGCSTNFKPDEAQNTQVIQIMEGASVRGHVAFTPNPVNVIAHTQITWTNMDTTEHQISSMSGFFEAPKPIKQGQSYSFIIDNPGNYRYYCLMPGHREQGVIHVTP